MQLPQDAKYWKILAKKLKCGHRARNGHLTGKGRGRLQRGGGIFSEASRTASRFLERGSQQLCYEGRVTCSHRGIFLSWLPQLPWAPELVVTGSQCVAVFGCQAPAVAKVRPFALGCFHSYCKRWERTMICCDSCNDKLGPLKIVQFLSPNTTNSSLS